MGADSERRYRDGVERWAARDLDSAVELIASALAVSEGPDVDGWWFSAKRALAQIAMERDDPDVAEANLLDSQGTLVGDAQTRALRARVALLRADEEAVHAEVAAAVLMTTLDQEREIGPLMNGAIALASCAEVLVELGYGDEAARVVAQASERTARAGIHDETLVRWLALCSAGAERLRGDREMATASLALVEPDSGDDFGIRSAREHARLAWDAGDLEAADRWYGLALDEAEAQDHAALARLVAAERTTGPLAMRTAEHPVDRWVEARSGGAELPAPEAEPLGGYPVVVTLTIDGPVERYVELDDQVTRLLEQRPELGYVDGFGTDGAIWQVFLDGDEPDRLWEAIRPLVEGIGPGRGSQATITQADGSWRVEPLAEPL